METKSVIAYYRRSTDKGQKHSIARQQNDVSVFCQANDLTVIHSFEETASGKNMEREQLVRALDLSSKTKMPIIVASLSRLGRNAGGVIALMDKQEIIVADKGMSCSKMVLSILAVVDQNERERIGSRTKAGLAAAKAKGIVLGNPRLEEARVASLNTRRANADDFALSLAHLILPLHQAGSMASQIARDLNCWDVKTRRGGKWTHRTVLNLIARVERIRAVEGE
jgi:DNA invertase Pin-like site-specific DNA recombinase